MGYYDRYRGTRRKKQQNKLLVFSLVLLVFIVVAVAILVLGDYVTYSADGFHFTWGDLLDNNKPPVTIPDDDSGDSDSNPDDDPDYVIDDNNNSQKPPFTLAQGQTGSILTDLSLFLSLDGALPSPLNGYAVWVKDTSGNRYLPSAIDNYNSNGLWSNAAALRDKANTLSTADGLHTLAVLNAFRDPLLPHKAYGAAAIDAGKAFWKDANGSTWLDPATAGGNIIVIEMIKRCKAAKFDEILLTDFRYPTNYDGDVSTITSVVEDNKANSLTAVAKQAKSTLGNANIKLSCLLTATAAQTLKDAAAGQDVTKLAQYIDCFYIETNDANIDLSVLKAALAGTDCTIALWYTGEASGYPTGYDFITVK